MLNWAGHIICRLWYAHDTLCFPTVVLRKLLVYYSPCFSKGSHFEIVLSQRFLTLTANKFLCAKFQNMEMVWIDSSQNVISYKYILFIFYRKIVVKVVFWRPCSIFKTTCFREPEGVTLNGWCLVLNNSQGWLSTTIKVTSWL